jgi:hydrogenase nickel incorporation protein HypA/HybF
MHEIGIACSILEAIAQELRQYPGRRASKVGLRIGEFAGVDPESLRFCFEVIARESEPARELVLDTEWCRVADGHRGDELEIGYLELEDSVEVTS